MTLQKLILLITTAAIFGACAQKNNMTTTLETDLDRVSYSIGVNIAQNLKKQGFDEVNSDALSSAIADYMSDSELKIKEDEINKVIETYFAELNEKQMEEAVREAEVFLAENAKRESVITTESGLQYEVLVEGNGEKPSLTDKVTTHYHGTFINGEVFDSSVERGQPATFPVNGVIKGWVEALQMMPVGSKWKLFVPSDLAYGPQGNPSIPGGSCLVFEVELISIEK